MDLSTSYRPLNITFGIGLDGVMCMPPIWTTSGVSDRTGSVMKCVLEKIIDGLTRFTMSYGRGSARRSCHSTYHVSVEQYTVSTRFAKRSANVSGAPRPNSTCPMAAGFGTWPVIGRSKYVMIDHIFAQPVTNAG